MARSNRGRNSSAKRSGGRSARPQTKRHYPRTARLNALLQEIVAGVIERIDDERFDLLTVTGVEVDNDLNKAEVFVSTLDQGGTEEEDEEFLEALSEYRKPVQAAIAKQARIRKTPEVVFVFDPAVRAGARIEEILSTIERPATDDSSEPDEAAESAESSETGESMESGE
jgi:ribosome-binding factor A